MPGASHARPQPPVGRRGSSRHSVPASQGTPRPQAAYLFLKWQVPGQRLRSAQPGESGAQPWSWGQGAFLRPHGCWQDARVAKPAVVRARARMYRYSMVEIRILKSKLAREEGLGWLGRAVRKICNVSLSHRKSHTEARDDDDGFSGCHCRYQSIRDEAGSHILQQVVNRVSWNWACL